MSEERYSDTVSIRRNGFTISRSRNLRGLREYCGKNIVALVAISEDTGPGLNIIRGTGILEITFRDGAYCRTRFADYGVLKNTLRNWRNLYGAPLQVNGLDVGKVEYSNPSLRDN